MRKGKNPLEDGETIVREGRQSWSLKEHCDYANSQLILKGIDDYRARKGMDAVHWVIRNDRVVLEPVKSIHSSRPLSQREIHAMPQWLREIGLRVGFIAERNGELVDVDAASGRG